jgi:predicted DsbA family dithiol-disulfide isomerase
MPAPTIAITEYTDPACPFAWSAEPSRRRLQWLYGDQLRWSLRMVGLSEASSDYERKGLTAEMLATGMAKLARAHHMPMDTTPRDYPTGTWPACRVVVATRLHQPESEAAILRGLRLHYFSRAGQLDEPATWHAAARHAGVDPDALDGWLAQDATEEAFREDLRMSRTPTPSALALDHKLADSEDGGRRYTCPSYELAHGDARATAPGFQPTESYEVAIANLAPELTRRETTDDVAEVLAWAGEPLATAEVAAVTGRDLDATRQSLSHVADETPIGAEGIWTLR